MPEDPPSTTTAVTPLRRRSQRLNNNATATATAPVVPSILVVGSLQSLPQQLSVSRPRPTTKRRLLAKKQKEEDDDDDSSSPSSSSPPPRSKKRIKQQEEEDHASSLLPTCCICLVDGISRRELANIDGCRHEFCFDCIATWSETQNKCPLCKARFLFISRVHPIRKCTSSDNNKKTPLNLLPVQDFDDEESDDDEDDTTTIEENNDDNDNVEENDDEDPTAPSPSSNNNNTTEPPQEDSVFFTLASRLFRHFGSLFATQQRERQPEDATTGRRGVTEDRAATTRPDPPPMGQVGTAVEEE